MIEVDIRRAGSGCVDNPVVVLSDYLSQGVPLRVIFREDQEGLVKELLEIAEYRVIEEKEEEGRRIIIAMKRDSAMEERVSHL